jgi:hypothetical protein
LHECYLRSRCRRFLKENGEREIGESYDYRG